MASRLAIKIIEQLEELSEYPLPDYGVIAGQSVAELYFRIKNIPIHTRIKDIDLFINLKNGRYLKKYSNYTRNREYDEKMYASTINEAKVLTANSSFAEENIEKVSNKKSYYEIKDVFNIKNLNIVELEYDKYERVNHKKFAETVLSKFDINSIEIGICLKTKRLFMTKAFKEFIKTKQVTITSNERPIRTICRYLEKSQYYIGAYFNFDYEVNMILPYYLLRN